MLLALAPNTNAYVMNHIKTGIVQYTYPGSGVLEWEKNKFDYYISGPQPHNSSAVWTSYVDHSAIYPEEFIQLVNSASAHGFNYEDALLHMKVDYQVPGAGSSQPMQWLGMDQFDIFEKVNGTLANGVLLLNGSSFSDVTNQSYAGNQTITISDKMLVGYAEPFAEMNFNISSAGSGSVAWQYWNGSAYAALTVSGDGTNGLKQSGKITFTPPADWAKKSENGSYSKYWVRAIVSGGAATFTKIYGDNWLPSSPNNGRGWDPNASGRVNIGLGNLEYNPNPPSGSSAKFRYQARTVGIWTNNLFFGNPSFIQNGKRPWAQFLTDRVIGLAQSQGFTGIMFDDGEGIPNLINPTYASSGNSDFIGSDWNVEHIAQYAQEVADLHAALPGFKVGANTGDPSMIFAGDFAPLENFEYVNGKSFSHYNESTDSVSLDQFKHANNPGDVKGLYMYADTGSDVTIDSGWYPWDRGNRGPMSALTTYYFESNENTAFIYNSVGWRYPYNDEYLYFKSFTQTTAPISADLSGSTKYIDGADFSSYPSSGTIKLGSTFETVDYTKVSNSRLSTGNAIHFDYPSGSAVAYVETGHQSTDVMPPVSQMYKWNNWFPAMGVDIGQPNPSGWNSGNRGKWLDASAVVQDVIKPYCGSCAPLYRRDFTNAIVLHRATMWGSVVQDITTFSKPIPLGGTYYQLYADGNTGPAITSIQLRGEEGAILLKSPVGTTVTVDIVPPNFSSITASSLTQNSANITWQSDKNCDSQVEYGLNSLYGSITTLNSAQTTSHSVSLSGLSSGTTYHFRVRSRDASGNLSISADQSFVTSAATYNPVLSGGQPWYASAWAFRKKITINRSQVSGTSTLLNFPVLISVADSEIKASANTSGSDLLFTAADGTTKLSYELESYDQSSGQIVAWVRVPSISAASDTFIYLYYGNSGSGNNQDPASVWDSNFKAVWHYLSAFNSAGLDSTSNNNTLSFSGSPALTSGQVGKAENFSISPSNGTASNSASLSVTGSFTLSSWVNIASCPPSGQYAPAFQKGGTNALGVYMLSIDSSCTMSLFIDYGQRSPNSSALNLNQWAYVTGVYDKAAGKAYIYVNGVPQGSNNFNWDVEVQNSNFSIAKPTWSYWNNSFFAKVDETRLSDTARSGDWIKTEYNNQSSPSSFASLSSQESYADSGSNPVGNTPANPNVSPSTAPTIVSFLATPSVIAPTKTALLSWSVQGADTVVIDKNVGAQSSVNTGSAAVSPSVTTTYTLTASKNGVSSQAQTTVLVSSQPDAVFKPVINSFSVSPSSVSPGQKAVLSWDVSANPSASFSLDNSIGSVTGTSAIIYPAQTTTYTLTATNSAGSASAQVTINVADFSAGATVSNQLRLIKDGSTYYLVQNNQKQGVTSPGILYSYGFEFKDAKEASAQDQSLPSGGLLLPGDGALVKSKQDPTVYLISSGKRYGFVSKEVFLGMGYKFSTVLLVTDPEMQALPKAENLNNQSAAHLPGTEIKDQNGIIYWIDYSGQRHPYASLSDYNSWHKDNDFSFVAPANANDLAKPVGDKVVARNIN